MRYKIAIMLITGLLAIAVSAQRQRTTRGNVRRATPTHSASHKVEYDTIVSPDSAMVRLYGYDKPLRSSRETVFLSNLTRYDIRAVSVTTQYLDSKGRQFHQSTQHVPVEVPAGSTRKVDYTSWDLQQSFYYVGSKRSRAAGTPYHVRLSVDTIFVTISNY